MSLVDRAFFHFSHSLFFKQLVSYPKTWSKVVSIQMNQTDEHEHKLVLLGSKLDEKSGKACAGKKQRTRGAQQLLLFGQRYTCLLAFFPAPAFSLVFTDWEPEKSYMNLCLLFQKELQEWHAPPSLGRHGRVSSSWQESALSCHVVCS